MPSRGAVHSVLRFRNDSTAIATERDGILTHHRPPTPVSLLLPRLGDQVEDKRTRVQPHSMCREVRGQSFGTPCAASPQDGNMDQDRGDRLL